MPYVPKPKVQKKRRVPVQARAIKRVNKILDTAAILIADPNIEKVTTHLIADKAGVSVGSVYQFFPNVESVKTAIIERLVDQYYARFDETIGANPEVASLEEFSALLISATHDFYQTQPEIVNLIVSSRMSEEFVEVNARLNERVKTRIAKHFANVELAVGHDEFLRRLNVVIAISDAMTMFIWSTDNEKDRKAYLHDWHKIVAHYSTTP